MGSNTSKKKDSNEEENPSTNVRDWKIATIILAVSLVAFIGIVIWLLYRLSRQPARSQDAYISFADMEAVKVAKDTLTNVAEKAAKTFNAATCIPCPTTELSNCKGIVTIERPKAPLDIKVDGNSRCGQKSTCPPCEFENGTSQFKPGRRDLKGKIDMINRGISQSSAPASFKQGRRGLKGKIDMINGGISQKSAPALFK